MRNVRLALAFALLPATGWADGLALKRVMLSTGGVGYFEYAAAADGPATLDLSVPLAQVDDVLASLVVFDSAGGIGGVDLPGHDGARAAFAALPFGPAALRSPLDLLNSLVGESVVVSGPRPMTGRLLHAEAVSESVPGAGPALRIAPRTRVSLLTDAGLQQFVLEDADSVQVADPAMRAAMARALEAARSEPAEAARHLTLRAGGQGARSIRVGYVAAAPLWKATFRLVLPGSDGAPARLQGWAVLENESGADWSGVDLTLQYGNPVTFRQALYRSYYVQRPEVPVEVLGRLLPGIDPGARPPQPALDAAAHAAPMLAAPMLAAPMAATRALAKTVAAPDLAAPAEPPAPAEAADATVFHLPAPVTLQAGHSATVPLLDRPVPATRVGVVQPGRTHPLQTVELRNDTGASLPAGVLTLYDVADAASFAGDARLGGVPPGETRLLEFADDLRTRVEWQEQPGTAIVAVTAAQGVLTIRRRERITHSIALTAPANAPRRLLLEIPRVTPDATAVLDGDLTASGETDAVWRVPVQLAAGQSRTVLAHVDRVVQEQSTLLEDDGALAAVLGSQALSAPARAALHRVADLRAALTQAEQGRDRLTAQRQSIEQDEARIRQNLSALTPGDALRTKLVHALEGDEDRLAAQATAAGEAAAAVTAARAALEQAVRTLAL